MSCNIRSNNYIRCFVLTTVVFRGPIFCRQCFQILLDLILSYRFIIMFINKKSLFFTTYLIFQTRTMRIQWAIFGPKVSVWHHLQQNVFYAKKRLLGQGISRLIWRKLSKKCVSDKITLCNYVNSKLNGYVSHIKKVKMLNN